MIEDALSAALVSIVAVSLLSATGRDRDQRDEPALGGSSVLSAVVTALQLVAVVRLVVLVVQAIAVAGGAGRRGSELVQPVPVLPPGADVAELDAGVALAGALRRR